MAQPLMDIITLDDKYTLEKGHIFVTGTQALVRLPLMQKMRDTAKGLNTGGFISGYRGSPLARLDQQLWRAQKFLKPQDITFTPGINEDLGATAVWGSQQANLYPGAKYDGVFAMWYGKGPGVDRSIDAIRHANAAGTHKNSGVLALCGDDHGCDSSTLGHQSDQSLIAAHVPVLYPATLEEYFTFGLIGWEMSRFSGAWVGLKCVTEIVESSASVPIDPLALDIKTPAFDMPPGGLNARLPDDRFDQEHRLYHKLRAATAFARENGVDRITVDNPNAKLGILTSGKSYLDVLQAFDDLGISEEMAANIGIRLYKVGLVWPVDVDGMRKFANGLEEIIVVEEKRDLLEGQLKEALYESDNKPHITGKYDEKGNWQFPAAGELSPAMIAKALAAKIEKFHAVPGMKARLDFLATKEKELTEHENKVVRLPYYCSGCPHNVSTKVPEGSRAVAGIGCHFMVLWMDRQSDTFTQMGGEGVTWVGQAPFTEEKHVFANLGDGTYFHSGILAIRQAVASQVNITFKILYNDAVAMTGGQPVEAPLTVEQVTRQLHAEGVSKILVVSDEPEKYTNKNEFASGSTFHHRDDMEHLQQQVRGEEGCTVIVYDQTCAAEKRRRRKRGQYPDPDKRVFINDAVCEGCGDCSVKSNCVSIEPLETEFGRKRQINQSSCNKDFSCLKGFCPSFVTVEGGKVKRSKAGESVGEDLFADLPRPKQPELDKPVDILVTGIGGTGVITIGAVLGMAAHIEGKGVTVLDQTGLAQKNGAVTSHLRIGKTPQELHAVRITDGGTDLLLACDMVVAANSKVIAKLAKGKTQAVVNSFMTPTAAFTMDTNTDFHEDLVMDTIKDAIGEDKINMVEATRIATALMGDSIATNMFMLGYAMQKGQVPVSLEALHKAIELNGVAVDANKQALAWGRLMAHQPEKVEEFAKPQLETVEEIATSLDDIIKKRVAFLKGYQSGLYANKYRKLVAKVREAEKKLGKEDLTEAVARYAYKLMAYKDEYEVARLYTNGDFLKKLNTQFEGDFKLKFHLAPPMIAPKDKHTGELQKMTFGPWMLKAFGLVAKLKFLRATPLDIFGKTAERKMERQLMSDYFVIMEEIIGNLNADNHETAVELAQLPDIIRGFGHVKEANIAKAKQKEELLLDVFRNPKTVQPADDQPKLKVNIG